MKPEWFREGICWKKPDPANLEATHVHLKDVEAEGLERLWCAMQGEVWSPNGEARPLIEAKGLQHTSMSVGDVAIDEAGVKYIVASFGFDQL
jgi:hypothetical protein